MQGTHRVLACGSVLCFLGVWATFPPLWSLGAVALAQGALGALIVIDHVPFVTATCDQLGAFGVLGVLLWGGQKYG